MSDDKFETLELPVGQAADSATDARRTDLCGRLLCLLQFGSRRSALSIETLGKPKQRHSRP